MAREKLTPAEAVKSVDWLAGSDYVEWDSVRYGPTYAVLEGLTSAGNPVTATFRLVELEVGE